VSSIVGFIEKLQDKPRHVRVRIMVFAVAVCMIVIVLIWLVSLKNTLSRNIESPQVQQEISNSLQEIKEQMPAGKPDLDAGIGSLFEKEESSGSPFETAE